MLRLVSTAWTLLVLLNYVVHGRSVEEEIEAEWNGEDGSSTNDFPSYVKPDSDALTEPNNDYDFIYGQEESESDPVSSTDIPTDANTESVSTNNPTDTEMDSVSTNNVPTDANISAVNTQDVLKADIADDTLCKENAQEGSDSMFALTDDKYYIYRVELNWFQAMEMCVLLGQRSATFNSEAEYKRLTDLLRRNEEFHKEGRYWTGGSELGRSGRYVWMPTGRPLKHSPWNDGEPNNTGSDRDKVEHCIELKGDNYGMNNRRCEMPGYVVCENII